MSKRIRDSLFIAFVFLFIVLTILVSLYATGYKFNLRWPPRLSAILVKTGMLVVDTNPSGAIIYLNDKPQTNPVLSVFSKNYVTTNAKIKNILPGQYDLRLERDGYWPFTGKINIYSGQTSFVENVNLFRNNLPMLVATSTTSNLLLSPNRQYLYAVADAKIINLKTEQVRNLPSTARTTGTFTPNNQVLSSGDIYDPETTGNDISYNKIIGTGATNWYYEDSTGRLYYQTAGALNRLENNGKTSTTLLSGNNFLSYEPRGDHLFVVVSEKSSSGSEAGKTSLRDYNLKTGNIDNQLTLPPTGEYRFVFDNRPYLSLYDDKNKTLYLINPSSLSSPEAINNILGWQWASDTQLFYYNNWEIYSFDTNRNSTSLITRVGETITGLTLGSGNYLIFLTDRGLSAVDFKAGVSTSLFRAEKINSAVLDTRNNTLYFEAHLGQSDGIYKLLLQ